MKNKVSYYILNLTWGLPLTLIGAIAALVVMIAGKKPQACGPCVHFKFGKNWGGVSLGLFIFTDTDSAELIKKHELGHTFQNAIFGPFMIPLAIISLGRYLMSRLFGVVMMYESFWLERDAESIGYYYFFRE